jgi:hypothetical protein
MESKSEKNDFVADDVTPEKLDSKQIVNEPSNKINSPATIKPTELIVRDNVNENKASEPINQQTTSQTTSQQHTESNTWGGWWSWSTVSNAVSSINQTFDSMFSEEQKRAENKNKEQSSQQRETKKENAEQIPKPESNSCSKKEEEIKEDKNEENKKKESKLETKEDQIEYKSALIENLDKGLTTVANFLTVIVIFMFVSFCPVFNLYRVHCQVL